MPPAGAFLEKSKLAERAERVRRFWNRRKVKEN
jgi:hypothetical protein